MNVFDKHVTMARPELAAEIVSEPLGILARGLKRSIDVLGASVVLVLFAPFALAIAVAIKRDSPGPVFFRQQRSGRHGRPFAILKFRTMTVMEDGDEVIQARPDDARVTAVGAWLRKTSLDEMPNLFNILKGEMSLVGPRPHALAHDAYYAKLIGDYEVRYTVKPGMTGWAQIHGLRGETESLEIMAHRVRFDLWYARHCSVWLDIKILWMTLFVVLEGRNAY